MNIQEIKHEFEGTGDMKPFTFSYMKENEKGFLYKVESEKGTIHYEVFKKELTPICIDFAKRIYSETEFKYRYPKTNDFGRWSWCTTELEKAEKMFKEL
jgi:hypothetical protein